LGGSALGRKDSSTGPVKTQASRWASVRYHARLPDWGKGPTEGAPKPAKRGVALP